MLQNFDTDNFDGIISHYYRNEPLNRNEEITNIRTRPSPIRCLHFAQQCLTAAVKILSPWQRAEKRITK